MRLGAVSEGTCAFHLADETNRISVAGKGDLPWLFA